MASCNLNLRVGSLFTMTSSKTKTVITGELAFLTVTNLPYSSQRNVCLGMLFIFLGSPHSGLVVPPSSFNDSPKIANLQLGQGKRGREGGGRYPVVEKVSDNGTIGPRKFFEFPEHISPRKKKKRINVII